MIIRSLTVKSSGMNIYEVVNIHKAIFIKTLLDFSDFARSTGKNQFWYLDSNGTNVTAAAATNTSIQQCGLLSHDGTSIECLIPLNRYSFFAGLSNRLLPTMQLEFEVVLQNDAEMIFQNDGTDRQIIVRSFELWIPQLKFSSAGQKLVNENLLETNSLELPE